MHHVVLKFCIFLISPGTRAMFPGRFPNGLESMWNYGWNPQSIGFPGQFCGGDPMGQQSQAETQAQISALQQQNALLNQHLHSQAQSHIQHLQQLIPYHQPPQQVQPPSIPVPSTSQPSAPQAQDPPVPVASPATQPGLSMTFNPDDMLQQMKHTVESSFQAMVEKTHERQSTSTPPPPTLPVTTQPPTISHPQPPLQSLPPQLSSPRRSRSHRHLSPRRRRSTRRPRRSSRPRSSPIRRQNSRRPDFTAITLLRIIPTNPSRHSPPTTLHLHHVRSRRSRPNRGMTLPTLLSTCLPAIFSSTYKILQEGSKEEWIRGVKFGLRHPERAPAASEVAPEKKPQPLQTVDIQEFDRAIEILRQTDQRIPGDIIKKAVHLLFSTYLLPDYDLEKSYIIELPSTNMFALIFPFPDSSHYQMPPPFRNHQNHTWALLHGTNLRTSQLILLEGKIRCANWSYNKNFNWCDMPTFGAFYLGREVSNSDKTFPEWVAKELMDTIQKKGKGQQDVVIGAMYQGAYPHTAFKAGGNEMAQLSVAEKGVATTSERNTRLPTVIMLG